MLHQAADASVGDGGEGDDQVADVRLGDDLVEILDGPEDRDIAAADLGDGARVLVEEADRGETVLGVGLEPAGHLGADHAAPMISTGLPTSLRPRPALGVQEHDVPGPTSEQGEQPGAHPGLLVVDLTRGEDADQGDRHRSDGDRAEHRHEAVEHERAQACAVEAAEVEQQGDERRSSNRGARSLDACTTARGPKARITARHSRAKSMTGRSRSQPGPSRAHCSGPPNVPRHSALGEGASWLSSPWSGSVVDDCWVTRGESMRLRRFLSLSAYSGIARDPFSAAAHHDRPRVSRLVTTAVSARAPSTRITYRSSRLERRPSRRRTRARRSPAPSMPYGWVAAHPRRALPRIPRASHPFAPPVGRVEEPEPCAPDPPVPAGGCARRGRAEGPPAEPLPETAALVGAPAFARGAVYQRRTDDRLAADTGTAIAAEDWIRLCACPPGNRPGCQDHDYRCDRVTAAHASMPSFLA